MRASATQDGEEKNMKIKKGLKLLSIFLAICAITLYLPNNIVTASAEQAQEPDSTEEETLYVETEESETDTGITSGDLIQIPSDDGDSSEMQVAGDDFSYHYYPPESGGAYIIQDGVYAFENVGNHGLWMDIQQDKYLPGYHMQQYAATGIPAQTFDRSCLFKITRRAETDSYIIRSMLNNRLTFYFSGNEVLTKEIPPDDDDVSVNDTFKLVYSSYYKCFVIKPYSSSNVVAANNTTASGMAGAPNSYLIKSTESTSGDQARWYMYQYTGETHSGVVTHKSISTTNGIEIGTTVSITFKTWTTEIGKNTPYLTVNPNYTDMVTATWDASTYTLTVTPTKVGTFKLRGIIRSDGTTTAFRTYALTYVATPYINGKVGFIKNSATGKYMDIEGPSKNEGAFIQQWQFNDKPQSKWLFEVQSGGYFTIKSQYSNMYVGVDPTNVEYIRQYDSIENNTLWKFIETSSGNYKLVCKSLETSGYVLATQSQTSGNGSNLMMTGYTDDTNYRDEWIWLVATPNVYIEFMYDNGFVDRHRNSGESIDTTKNRISDNIINEYFPKIHIAFLEMCNINIGLRQTEIPLYTSDADLCGNSDINTPCNCISDCELLSTDNPHNNNSSVGFEYDAHCKSLIRIRNNLIVDMPSNTIRVAYTGHVICYVSNDFIHSSEIVGLADFTYPIIALRRTQDNRKRSILVLAHELTHLYGVTHHQKISGTICIMDEERYTYNDPDDYSTYWCQNCINQIKENADKH